MSVNQQTLAAGRPIAPHAPWRPAWRGLMRGSEFLWALAFVAPYAAVFLGFVVFPFGYALWMVRQPSLYGELVSDPSYLPALLNTLLFVGVGVNVKMFLALLLSGFFLRRRWWIKPLLAVYVLPWLIAAAQACVSFHWMLIGELGLVDRLLSELFGIDGPLWFNDRWLALGSNIVAYTWKWMPFWTVIFLAARMTIPRDIYDAASIDGATGVRRFLHVTFPLMANLYLVCTLLSTLFTLGDFNSVYFVSGGGPALSTHVLATISIRNGYEIGRPDLGVAAVMSALPLMIPLVLLLMRKLHTTEVTL
jgi:multiple sugar transport system permease protein